MRLLFFKPQRSQRPFTEVTEEQTIALCDLCVKPLSSSVFIFLVFFCLLQTSSLYSQQLFITGRVSAANEPLQRAVISLQNPIIETQTDNNGNFRLGPLFPGTYQLSIKLAGYDSIIQTVKLNQQSISLEISMNPSSYQLSEVLIADARQNFGITRMRDVEGTSINAGRKTEVIQLANIDANFAANNNRQVFSRITGLNIWESDAGGLQMGIGGRGLNPNRTAHINTRQNGYDMSADALGYPESYYSPPMLAVEKVEIIRGAASLQYGPQFGGMANFVMKSGPEEKGVEAMTSQTIGSFGFYNGFASVGVNTGKVKSYSFYQYKRGEGWRPNEGFHAQTAYSALQWQTTDKLKLSLEFTHMDYLAQQAGGLSDMEFAQNPRLSTRSRNYFAVNWNLGAIKLDYKLSTQTQLNSRTFGLYGGRKALGYRGPVTSIDPYLIERAPSYTKERDLLVGDFRNVGNETRLIHRYELKGMPQSALIGFRLYKGFNHSVQGNGNAGTDANFRFLNSENPEKSAYRFPSSNVAAFAEHIFRLNGKWSITPGFRYEYIRTTAKGHYREILRDLADNIIVDETFPEERAQARSFLIGGLGVSYKANQGFESYFNISQNYRSISFNDFREVNPSFRIDPDLKDERGFNADLGFRGNHKNWLVWEATLFYLSYDDRIGSVQRVDEQTFSVYRYRTNISDSYTFGLESLIEADVLQMIGGPADHSLHLFSNLALLDSRYVRSDEAAINGKKVEMVPNIVWRTGLRYKWEGLSASFSYAYVGEHFSDATNAVQVSSAVVGVIPAYAVMDFSLAYKYKWLGLEGGVNNLADKRYFTRRAEGYPGPGIIPAAGRSFYVGVNMCLGN